MRWFKFYGVEYLSDPKMLVLTAAERSCWFTLLSYGSVNDDGAISFLGEKQLMIQSGIDPVGEEWNKTVGVLEKFKKLGMVQVDEEVITLINWAKRQEVNLTGYERTKRYREKNKEKLKARAAVQKAISEGTLVKSPCLVCGNPESESHHPDYSKVLEVVWFCKKHHEEAHMAANLKQDDDAMMTLDMKDDDAMTTLDKKRIDKNRIELPFGVWGSYPSAQKLPRAGSIRNTNALKRLLPRCRGITPDIKKAFSRLSGYSDKDYEVAIKNYVLDIINRDPRNDYSNHRFSFYEFFNQKNGFLKFVNR